MMPKLKIPPKTRKLFSALAAEAEKRALPLYLVGGAVRDFILNRKTFDLDFTVEGDPKPLADFCGKLLKTTPISFDSFGTWNLTGAKNLRIDFATTRREDYPNPASLPVVKTPAPILEDLKRRDFTINAMALRIQGSGFSDLIDPFGGLNDLKAGRVQILHGQSFRDDPTRVFRAARYASRFQFECAPEISRLAVEALKAGYPQKLSRHRLAMELLKILGDDDPRGSLETLRQWGYLDLIHPQLSKTAWPKFKKLGADVGLGVLAFALGNASEDFISSLPVDRRVAGDILAALKTAKEKGSPRADLSEVSKKIIQSALPGLPAQALETLKISGADLESMGIPSGPVMGDILKEAARLQWSGKIKSRVGAMRWARQKIVQSRG